MERGIIGFSYVSTGHTIDNLNPMVKRMSLFLTKWVKNNNNNSNHKSDKGTGSKVWKGETEGCGRELSECIRYMHKIFK